MDKDMAKITEYREKKIFTKEFSTQYTVCLAVLEHTLFKVIDSTDADVIRVDMGDYLFTVDVKSFGCAIYGCATVEGGICEKEPIDYKRLSLILKIYCKLRDRANAKVATSYEIVAYEGDAYSREGDELYGYSFHSNVDEQFSHDMLSMDIYFNEACYKSDSASIRRSGVVYTMVIMAWFNDDCIDDIIKVWQNYYDTDEIDIRVAANRIKKWWQCD